MNYRAMSVCVFVALAVAMASAQTKTTMSGKCGKADVEHSLPAGDQQGRTFTLSQGKCTVTGDVGGVAGGAAAGKCDAGCCIHCGRGSRDQVAVCIHWRA